MALNLIHLSMVNHKLQYQSTRQSRTQISYSATSDLINLENGLHNYNIDIVKKLSYGLGFPDEHRSKILLLDFGAGIGTLAEIWRGQFGVKPICIEIDKKQIQILKSKGFKVFSKISAVSGLVDYVYSSNVLEHIEDDFNTLKEIQKRMKIGGKIAIYVPALPFLFSDLDIKVGHFRRYRRSELLRKVKAAGFEITDCYYNDCLGVFASIILKIFGYNNKNGLGSIKTLIFYDKIVYPISKVLDHFIFKHVIGKNLVLFAVNPKNDLTN